MPTLAERIAEAQDAAAPVRLGEAEVDRSVLEALQAAELHERTEAVQASDYLLMLQGRLGDLFGAGVLEVVDWEPLLEILFWVALVAVSLVLLSTAAVGVRQILRARSQGSTPATVQIVAQHAPPPARDLRQELEGLLDGGDADAALTALWSWLAARLHEAGRARWTPDATHRELVASTPRDWSGRGPLARLCGRVEHLLFSGTPADMEGVRRLLPEAERVVAAAEGSP